ncbi:insulin-like growth factor-binding protein complex acid labile subunit isoform X2 [Xiphias gladius]|uniref:insulin-like growth factor-binding protein complex acid labile subunit isoform X2 n=1 Tax=Xiphias gladius TaxID=8245 RepID=UPI001A98C32B|nr:insulin-like growth factor-binding protein complex acid labile subunit isoform X2 [Xiphias gladius]
MEMSGFLVSRIAECSRLCPLQCVCYEHGDLVDCRARGFEHVPRGLPHGMWLLELGGNNLSEIGTRAFTGLWSLRVLVMTNSQIQEIQPQAFFSLSFLEKLDLSWNQLTSLPADFSASLFTLRELRLEHNNLHYISGYRYLTGRPQSATEVHLSSTIMLHLPISLLLLIVNADKRCEPRHPPKSSWPYNSLEFLDNMEKLDLSYNQLVSVGPGVFRGLSRLRKLYLHNNRLTVVQQGSMDMLPGLQVLQLSKNNISKIDSEALAPLYSLTVLALEGNNLHHLKFKTFISLHTTATHIQLSGNPWSCDCELHRVFSKILHVRHLHIDDYRNVTCKDPPQLSGASLAWVDSQLCVAETVTVLVITVTVLVTVVAALVMAERNRKRNRGKNWDTESQTQTQSPPS